MVSWEFFNLCLLDQDYHSQSIIGRPWRSPPPDNTYLYFMPFQNVKYISLQIKKNRQDLLRLRIVAELPEPDNRSRDHNHINDTNGVVYRTQRIGKQVVKDFTFLKGGSHRVCEVDGRDRYPQKHRLNFPAAFPTGRRRITAKTESLYR